MNKIGNKKYEEEYFQRGSKENPKFVDRFEYTPDFTNKNVLDLGCGHGSLCIFIAQSGAKKVTGIDLDKRRISFAKNKLNRFPKIKDKIVYKNIDLKDLKEEFDIIVSKDTFEHIIEFDNILKVMKTKLKKGGKIYAGFGPLYYSYYGDHTRTRAIIPWGHIIFPEKYLINRLNNKYKYDIKSVQDLGLNKLKVTDFIKIIKNNKYKIVSFQVNVSKNIVMKIFNILRKIPFLREYFSYNVYCILEK